MFLVDQQQSLHTAELVDKKMIQVAVHHLQEIMIEMEVEDITDMEAVITETIAGTGNQ